MNKPTVQRPVIRSRIQTDPHERVSCENDVGIEPPVAPAAMLKLDPLDDNVVRFVYIYPAVKTARLLRKPGRPFPPEWKNTPKDLRKYFDSIDIDGDDCADLLAFSLDAITAAFYEWRNDHWQKLYEHVED